MILKAFVSEWFTQNNFKIVFEGNCDLLQLKIWCVCPCREALEHLRVLPGFDRVKKGKTIFFNQIEFGDFI